jgi:tetratricopeptide (TPR) repeat protein/SAM-dependent methyltransferase
MGSNPILSASRARGFSMNRSERRAARKRGQGADALARPGSDVLFAQAVHHHQRGHLAEAEAVCRTILIRDPRHAGSLHLLGVIAQQRGDDEAASAHLRGLVRVRPEFSDGHFRLGHVLAQMGKLDEALQSIERARILDSDPRSRRAPEETPDYAWVYQNLANLCIARQQFSEGAKLFQRSLALNPDAAEAHNGYGALLVAQGRLAEASVEFARALALAPELLNSYADLRAALFAISLVTKNAVVRAAESWPRRLSFEELLGTGGASALMDPLLISMLESGPVYDIEFERMLTSLRAALLNIATGKGPAIEDANLVRLACVLAQQCFSNEYVFLPTDEENAQAELLRQHVTAALRAGGEVQPLCLAAVACYFPLSILVDDARLLDKDWPEPLAAVLARQVHEVRQERELRNAIPRLTAIEDAVSIKVREQYEENPYPRWIAPASRPKALTFQEYFGGKFPGIEVRPPPEETGLDVLIAGCGTGQHPIGMAQTFQGARVLAVDLSLASLSYALRKTREMELSNIEYAQADLLRLGPLGRNFDVIDASGVLHHLADPLAGWNILLRLLRPRGVMRVGLYSELGRRDVVAAQRYVEANGYRATANDVRACRHDLVSHGHGGVAKFHDFFSTSECRDFLFHVQEHRHSLPEIRDFLTAHGLELIGFELSAATRAAYRARFPNDLQMRDLDHWHSFESEHPDTFAAMYQFWCQKN